MKRCHLQRGARGLPPVRAPVPWPARRPPPGRVDRRPRHPPRVLARPAESTTSSDWRAPSRTAGLVQPTTGSTQCSWRNSPGSRWRSCRRSAPTLRRRDAVPHRTDHRRATPPVAAGHGMRRSRRRDRDDRTIRGVGPGRHPYQAHPRWRRVPAHRYQDFHHQRRVGRPGRRGGEHQPGEACPRHQPGRGRSKHGGVQPRPGARQGRPDRGRHRRTGLRQHPDPTGERARHHRLWASTTSWTSCRRSASAAPWPPWPTPGRSWRRRRFRMCASAGHSRSRSASSSTTGSWSPSWPPRSTAPRHSSTPAWPPTGRRGSVRSTPPRRSGGRPQQQNEVIDHCLQLHGGYGYMNEYRVARAWRDARVTKIWAGSNEIMKEIIGRSLGLADQR